MLNYISIDLKSFYASVECLDRGLDPLTARLVVADEARTDKTICLAVSPALKKFGIPGRARLFQVKSVLAGTKKEDGSPVDFIIATPRMSRYMEVSAAVFSCYLEFVSIEDIHPYSIDECFFDVSSYLALYGTDARGLALKMIKRVLEKTGVTATAGVGTNLYLAKIAMDIMAKRAEADEDGVRIACLDEESYRRELWEHRPITDFWRIGRGIAKKLEIPGIFTMGDVARQSLKDPDILFDILGVDAELLIDHAWGYESCTMAMIKSFRSESSSITEGQVLQRPYSTEEAGVVIREMGEELAFELMDRGLVSDGITLTIGYDREAVDDGSYTGETEVDFYGRVLPKRSRGTLRLIRESDSAEDFAAGARELFDRIAVPGLKIRRMHLDAIRTREKTAFIQMNIFDIMKQQEPNTLEKDDESRTRVQEAVLELKNRFGKNAVMKGLDLLDEATARERHGMIGGHRG